MLSYGSGQSEAVQLKLEPVAHDKYDDVRSGHKLITVTQPRGCVLCAKAFDKKLNLPEELNDTFRNNVLANIMAAQIFKDFFIRFN